MPSGSTGAFEAGVAQDTDSEAGDPGLDAVGPISRIVGEAERVAQVPARHGGEHQRGVADGAGHRAGDGDAREGARRPLWNAAVGGFQADKPAPRGGDAHRPAGIGADVQRPEPSRAGRARAGGRSAGGVSRVPWVARDAVQRVVAGGFPAELGGRGLTQNHRAGRFETDDHRRIVGHRVGAGGAAASAGRETREIDEVFHRAGDTVEDPDRAAGAPSGRAFRRRLKRAWVHHGKRVQARVQSCHTLGDRLQHVDRS